MAVFGNTCKSSRWVWALTLQAMAGKVGWGRKQHLASVSDQSWSGLEMKFAFFLKTNWIFQAIRRYERNVLHIFCYGILTAAKGISQLLHILESCTPKNPNKTFLKQIYTSMHKIFYWMFIDKYCGVSHDRKTMPSLTEDFVLTCYWWWLIDVGTTTSLHKSSTGYCTEREWLYCVCINGLLCWRITSVRNPFLGAFLTYLTLMLFLGDSQNEVVQWHCRNLFFPHSFCHLLPHFSTSSFQNMTYGLEPPCFNCIRICLFLTTKVFFCKY